MGLAASLRSRRSGSGASAESRLALLEFLISSADLDASARYALDWLGTHGGVTQAVCALIDVTGTQLLGVAEYGAQATAWEFSVALQDTDHPLIGALRSFEAHYFDAGAARAWSPLDDVALHAIPLQVPGSTDSEGLLIVEARTPVLGGEIRWFADIFSQQVTRLRTRHAIADEHGTRERMLLYNSINAVTDPILITDPEGKLIIANARAEKLFTSPDDASEGWRQAVGLNNMLFSAALSSSAMEAEGTSRRELLLVDSIEGSDLLFELLSSVVKDPREGTFVVSILRNVTDLGRATEEIEESHRKLRIAQAEVREERHRLDLIIDSVSDPILVKDPEGDIVRMNAPAEKLFTVEGDRGERVQRRVEANGVHFSSFVSSMLASGSDRRWRGDVGLTDPETGLPMPFEAIAGKILSDQGELTWIVTILHDHTETIEKARLYEQLKLASKELEGKVQAATAELAEQNELLRRQALELEQASALKTQFLANMSHEFRTPLNAILGYTHMLLHGVSGPMTLPQKSSLTRIDSNGRHLLALINEILDITRIEAGRMPLQVTEFKLPDLLREVMSELDPIVVRSRLAVTIDIPPRVPSLRSDRQKVKQIVLNLLSNALKFTQRGWVRIDARWNGRGKTVSIAVSDTGIGIAREDQDKVFEDFRQLDVSASRGYGGTGLGLSICRRLAETLGGTIRLESAVGQGSTFIVTLPIRLRKTR